MECLIAIPFFRFTSNDPKVLQLFPNDQILVFDYYNEEWLKGVSLTRTVTGIFPFNYVELKKENINPSDFESKKPENFQDLITKSKTLLQIKKFNPNENRKIQDQSIVQRFNLSAKTKTKCPFYLSQIFRMHDKKGDWRTYLFMIDKNEIQYFDTTKKPNHNFLIGKIPISDIDGIFRVHEDIENMMSGFGKNKKQRIKRSTTYSEPTYSFNFIANNQLYSLRTDSFDVVNEWANTIQLMKLLGNLKLSNPTQTDCSLIKSLLVTLDYLYNNALNERKKQRKQDLEKIKKMKQNPQENKSSDYKSYKMKKIKKKLEAIMVWKHKLLEYLFAANTSHYIHIANNPAPKCMGMTIEDSQSNVHNELHFSKFEMVTIIRSSDTEHWLGECNGKRGYFSSKSIMLLYQGKDEGLETQENYNSPNKQNNGFKMIQKESLWNSVILQRLDGFQDMETLYVRIKQRNIKWSERICALTPCSIYIFDAKKTSAEIVIEIENIQSIHKLQTRKDQFVVFLIKLHLSELKISTSKSMIPSASTSWIGKLQFLWSVQKVRQKIRNIAPHKQVDNIEKIRIDVIERKKQRQTLLKGFEKMEKSLVRTQQYQQFDPQKKTSLLSDFYGDSDGKNQNQNQIQNQNQNQNQIQIQNQNQIQISDDFHDNDDFSENDNFNESDNFNENESKIGKLKKSKETKLQLAQQYQTLFHLHLKQVFCLNELSAFAQINKQILRLIARLRFPGLENGIWFAFSSQGYRIRIKMENEEKEEDLAPSQMTKIENSMVLQRLLEDRSGIVETFQIAEYEDVFLSNMGRSPSFLEVLASPIKKKKKKKIESKLKSETKRKSKPESLKKRTKSTDEKIQKPKAKNLWEQVPNMDDLMHFPVFAADFVFVFVNKKWSRFWLHLHSWIMTFSKSSYSETPYRVLDLRNLLSLKFDANKHERDNVLTMRIANQPDIALSAENPEYAQSLQAVLHFLAFLRTAFPSSPTTLMGIPSLNQTNTSFPLFRIYSLLDWLEKQISVNNQKRSRNKNLIKLFQDAGDGSVLTFERIQRVSKISINHLRHWRSVLLSKLFYLSPVEKTEGAFYACSKNKPQLHLQMNVNNQNQVAENYLDYTRWDWIRVLSPKDLQDDSIPSFKGELIRANTGAGNALKKDMYFFFVTNDPQNNFNSKHCISLPTNEHVKKHEEIFRNHFRSKTSVNGKNPNQDEISKNNNGKVDPLFFMDPENLGEFVDGYSQENQAQAAELALDGPPPFLLRASVRYDKLKNSEPHWKEAILILRGTEIRKLLDSPKSIKKLTAKNRSKSKISKIKSNSKNTRERSYSKPEPLTKPPTNEPEKLLFSCGPYLELYVSDQDIVLPEDDRLISLPQKYRAHTIKIHNGTQYLMLAFETEPEFVAWTNCFQLTNSFALLNSVVIEPGYLCEIENSDLAEQTQINEPVDSEKTVIVPQKNSKYFQKNTFMEDMKQRIAENRKNLLSSKVFQSRHQSVFKQQQMRKFLEDSKNLKSMENIRDWLDNEIHLHLYKTSQARNEILLSGNDNINRLNQLETKLIEENRRAEKLRLWHRKILSVILRLYIKNSPDLRPRAYTLKSSEELGDDLECIYGNNDEFLVKSSEEKSLDEISFENSNEQNENFSVENPFEKKSIQRRATQKFQSKTTTTSETQNLFQSKEWLELKQIQPDPENNGITYVVNIKNSLYLLDGSAAIPVRPAQILEINVPRTKFNLYFATLPDVIKTQLSDEMSIFHPAPEPNKKMQLMHLLLAFDLKLVSGINTLLNQPEPHIIESFLVVFEYKKMEMQLFDLIVDTEVKNTQFKNSLFRVNNFSCKILAKFAQRIGRDFLVKTLRPFLEEMIELFQNNTTLTLEFEVINPFGDDNQSQNEKNAKLAANEQRIELVQKYTSKIMNTILNSIQNCPLSFRELCFKLYHKSVERFPDAGLSVISGFFFLRFLCPAIVAPHIFGVLGLETKLGPRITNALLTISKLVQSIANECPFHPDSDMFFFNDFIQGYFSKTQKFMKSLIQRCFVVSAAQDFEEIGIKKTDDILVIGQVETKQESNSRNVEDISQSKFVLGSIGKSMSQTWLIPTYVLDLKSKRFDYVLERIPATNEEADLSLENIYHFITVPSTAKALIQFINDSNDEDFKEAGNKFFNK
ncbi:ras gtpase-activating protein [Anaeramoeba ignava]|uniref:Ras gtpase-activating protein n=1 Tax=Anaeramoeba ignava TaxID=1746090 RepID=A0A9Q0LVP8_ANAIG|nr:ras gtpase-activating protein [Anaeramoeba ignava]